MNKLYVSERLREYRAEKGYSQEEFVTLFNFAVDEPVSASLYSKWETQEKSIKPDWALELSRFTRIPLAELIVRK